MEVKLPRPATGKEIADAFVKAVKTVELPGTKLEVKEVVSEYRIEPGSVKQVIKSLTITIPIFLERTIGFFRKRTDYHNCDYAFKLKEIKLEDSYNTVDISCYYDNDLCSFVDDLRVLSPGSRFHATFKSVLAIFHNELQPGTAL